MPTPKINYFEAGGLRKGIGIPSFSISKPLTAEAGIVYHN